MWTGFTAKDFDAYAPNKWKSNVFNRERLEVKQKLVDLGALLQGALVAADGSPLLCEPSAEHPALWNHKQVEAQHLFFSRNVAARKELDRFIDRSRPMTTMLEDPTPQRNHVFLALSLSLGGLDFSLKLHPDARVDRQNLEHKLADAWELGTFVDLLRALPPGHRLGVTEQATSDAATVDAARVHALLADIARAEAPGKTHWLTVARTIGREEILAAGPGLVDAARAELDALLPLYHFVAWSRDNDYIEMRETLLKDKQVKRQKGLAKGDKVKIVRGMLAGRVGAVQEIDAKGGLKVLVGTLAVKVGAGEVEKA
jgi:hypothetical protein